MARRKKRRTTFPPTPSAELETTVFRSGNSDAVRLPARLGLLGKRVYVRRVSEGRLVIETKGKRRWPRGFLESFGSDRVSADFAAPPRLPASAKDETRAARRFDEIE